MKPISINSENKIRYPNNWESIRGQILERAGHSCEFCDAVNRQPHPVTGHWVVLIITHLDQTPENNDPGNLKALCQKCHLELIRQAKLTRFLADESVKKSTPPMNRSDGA